MIFYAGDYIRYSTPEQESEISEWLLRMGEKVLSNSHFDSKLFSLDNEGAWAKEEESDEYWGSGQDVTDKFFDFIEGVEKLHEELMREVFKMEGN